LKNLGDDTDKNLLFSGLVIAVFFLANEIRNFIQFKHDYDNHS